jgi:protein-S-isoprenylcysteine O-methyltransferase Ste14
MRNVMDGNYLLLAGLCLTGLMIRTGYELLKRAGKLDPKDPVIFAGVFAAMFAWLASWPFMCPLDPLRILFSPVMRWIGLGLVTGALILAAGGLLQLRGLENIDHLVTTGLYSKFRHPMYVGFILWIAGWVVSYGATVSFVLGLVCIGNILFWRHLEERALGSHYGEKYKVYRQTTWF